MKTDFSQSVRDLKACRTPRSALHRDDGLNGAQCRDDGSDDAHHRDDGWNGAQRHDDGPDGVHYRDGGVLNDARHDDDDDGGGGGDLQNVYLHEASCMRNTPT